MNKEIKTRGIIAIIFTVSSISMTLSLFVKFLKNGSGNVISSFLGAALLGFVLGGMIVGFCHLPAVHKKIKGALKIPFLGWAVYLVLIIGVPYFGGWIFMLTDLTRYLKARKTAQS